MAPYGKVPIARVVYSRQRGCSSCVGSDVAVTSSPAPSRRPHRMLNVPSVILIEKME